MLNNINNNTRWIDIKHFVLCFSVHFAGSFWLAIWERIYFCALSVVLLIIRSIHMNACLIWRRHAITISWTQFQFQENCRIEIRDFAISCVVFTFSIRLNFDSFLCVFVMHFIRLDSSSSFSSFEFSSIENVRSRMLHRSSPRRCISFVISSHVVSIVTSFVSLSFVSLIAIYQLQQCTSTKQSIRTCHFAVPKGIKL